MKKIVIFLVWLAIMIQFVCLCKTDVFAEESQPVAIVTNVKGGATLFTAIHKKQQPLFLLSELVDGDKIFVKAKGEAKIVFYKDTHSEIINGPCSVRISKNSCIADKGQSGSVKVLSPYKGIQAIRSIRSSSEKFAGVGIRTVKTLDKVCLIRPKGFVASINPTFEWKAFENADSYKVSVEDLDGKQVFSNFAHDSFLQYPKDSPSLQFGISYFWFVKVIKNDRVISIGSDTFRVIPKEKFDEMTSIREQAQKQLSKDPKDTSPYVVLLAFYMEHGLLDEALDTCSTILKMSPKDKNTLFWMGKLKEMRGMQEEKK